RIRAPRPAPLFPYTTLFRSRRAYASTSPTPARLTASRLRRSNMTLYRDKAVRRHGHRVYAAIDKKLGKLGMVARRLAAQPDLRRSEEHTSELQSRDNLVCRL